ncbi:hypothetical protein B0H14DRAFT_2585640 [Mycena olivaceomarginata]|nr:hypothetical protein B0H14DRAFT_2585640 [Mycena olivaceomarginata]
MREELLEHRDWDNLVEKSRIKVPAAPKLLASKVKIHKPEEVDIPAMVTSSRIRLGKTPYEFQKRFFSNVMQGRDVVLDIEAHLTSVLVNVTILAISRACGLGSVIFADIFAEDIPSEVLECFVLYRFWPNAEREESALKVLLLNVELVPSLQLRPSQRQRGSTPVISVSVFRTKNIILREYIGSFDGGCYDSQDVRDFLIPIDQILGSMAVVSWPGPEIRYRAPTALLYNESGELRATALPNADIAAFWHNSQNGYFIHVFRTSYEKILHQLVWPPAFAGNPRTRLATCPHAGSLAGSISGTTFTDNDTGIDNKVIRKVSMRSGDIVTGLSLQFSNRSSAPWRGGQGGRVP